MFVSRACYANSIQNWRDFPACLYAPALAVISVRLTRNPAHANP